jgi:hypothetical protein
VRRRIGALAGIVLLVTAAAILVFVAAMWLRGNQAMHPTTTGTTQSASPAHPNASGSLNTSQVHTPSPFQTGPKPPAVTPTQGVTSASPTPGQSGPPPPSGSATPASS